MATETGEITDSDRIDWLAKQGVSLRGPLWDGRYIISVKSGENTYCRDLRKGIDSLMRPVIRVTITINDEPVASAIAIDTGLRDGGKAMYGLENGGKIAVFPGAAGIKAVTREIVDQMATVEFIPGPPRP